MWTIEIFWCGASQVSPSGSEVARSTCGVIWPPSGYDATYAWTFPLRGSGTSVCVCEPQAVR